MTLAPATRAYLFDLDGVFYNDTRPIPGGADVVAQLRARSVPFRFVTNTTSKSRVSIAAKLQSLGVSAEPHEVFCPAVAAAAFLREKNASGVFFTTDDTRSEFAGLREDLTQPAYLVLGDLGDDWSSAKLNQVLRYVLNGAQLIALGMSRYWHADDGPRLDVGPLLPSPTRPVLRRSCWANPPEISSCWRYAICTSIRRAPRWWAMTLSPISAGHKQRACAPSSSARGSSGRRTWMAQSSRMRF